MKTSTNTRITQIKSRIALLGSRRHVDNSNIINKLKRELRRLEANA